VGTFFLTIFGTFLTRSGLIASVHSFARSDIGIYFAWYMVFLAIFFVALVSWRLPELRGKLLDAATLAGLDAAHPALDRPLAGAGASRSSSPSGAWCGAT
jgi:cytochrome c biogenesis factor